MRALQGLSLLAILTVSATRQSELPLSRIRVVTATEDTRAIGAMPHLDRSVPDAQVSPRVENWLSQYRDEHNAEMQSLTIAQVKDNVSKIFMILGIFYQRCTADQWMAIRAGIVRIG